MRKELNCERIILFADSIFEKNLNWRKKIENFFKNQRDFKNGFQKTKDFFLNFKNNNLKHSKNYQKHFIFTLCSVKGQNKNICPGRVSNPPQAPLKAAHFDHYGSKIFFLKSKKF